MNHRIGTRVRSLAAALLAASTALGAAPCLAADYGLMFKAGWDTGRDVLLEVPFATGPSQNIRVNDGAYAGGGIALISDSREWEVELSASYKTKLVTGDNGQLEWHRIPVDLMLFHRTRDHRVGMGVTYHLLPRLRGTGDAQTYVEFKNAPGFMTQFDLLVGERGNIGLRFMVVEYEAKNINYKIRSVGVGVTAGMSFW